MGVDVQGDGVGKTNLNTDDSQSILGGERKKGVGIYIQLSRPFPPSPLDSSSN
jgi:hypothetical protein